MADINLGVGGANSAVAGGYEVDNSVKTEADNSEWMQRATGGGNDSNLQKHSISTWVKRTELGGTQMILSMANIGRVRFDSSNKLQYQFASSGGGALTTTRVFRDTSAWYHIFVVADSTLSTANDRLKIYVNGVRETSFDYNVAPTQNSNSNGWGLYNSYNLNFAGKSDDFYNGYIAETFFIGEQSLLPTDFGEFDDNSGIWIPKKYTGTFGSNDTYLDFKDSSNLGNNAAGGADLSLNNLTSADQATDTPTNNFCTWTRLWTFPKVAGIENGGTSTNADFNASTWRGAKGSMGVSKGKWYWEQKASGNDTIVGWQTDNCVPDSGTNSHNTISTIAYYEGGNFLWIKDSTSGRNADTVSGTYAGGQIVGIALNLDSSPQTVTFYRNGSAILSNRNIDGLANQTLFPMTSHYNQTSDANFGGYTNFTISSGNTDENGYGTFEYAPPSGYYALCTKNLAEYG